MHIPDGFIDPPVSLAAGALALGGVGLALRRTDTTLRTTKAPLTGLVAAFVFAVQMLNFPVAAGTSGHLLGGTLAAILLGPWLGALAVTVVLVVQCLLFADGGLTALGLNVCNMALLPSFGGWALFCALRRVLPTGRRGVLGATAITSMVSVVGAAAGFTLEYALGGRGGVPIATVAAAMIGVHVLIGIGEAVITTLTVSTVLDSRPDLVHGAREPQASRGGDLGRFLVAGLALTVVLAFGVSRFASTKPDGLQRVADDHGIAAHEVPHHLTQSPFAHYEVRGIGDAGLTKGLAGLAGVGAAFGVGWLAVRGRRRNGDHVGSVRAAAPEVKLVAFALFVVAVVATPLATPWVFAVHALALVVVAGLARIPGWVLVRRVGIEAPFVVFALAMPFLAGGPTTTVAGLVVSRAGLHAGIEILVTATLTTVAAVLLGWSTSVADLLAGLERLRVPAVLVAIAGFMVRYGEVIGGELRRLQIARVSRGDNPRWLWQAQATASTAGTLFVRSYERGERVHQAMLARGFDGRMPQTARPARRAWTPALAVVAPSVLLTTWAVLR